MQRSILSQFGQIQWPMCSHWDTVPSQESQVFPDILRLGHLTKKGPYPSVTHKQYQEFTESAVSQRANTYSA